MAISDEEADYALKDLETLEDFMMEYGSKLQQQMEAGDIPFHAPHGLLTFCHVYYHQAFIAQRDAEARAIFDKAEAEGIDTENVDLDLDSIQHDMLWKMFTSLIMFGVHMAEEGVYRKLRQCNCTELDEKGLAALLNGGEHDHN